jgi:tetratricopeptide (TPR) repeat protein
MKKNLVFLIVGLLFFSKASAQDESRASKTWEVQKYDIAATLPSSETDRYLNVKAVLDLKNVGGSAGSRLTLRISDKAEVSAVKVNQAPAEFSKGEEKIGGNRNLQRILIRLPSIQPSAIFSVTVNYKLKVDENSGLNALSPVGSQFLPLSFWYPTPNSWYFARGAENAPFRIQINSSNGETIVSSGTQNTNGFEQKLYGQPFFTIGVWATITANNVSVLVPKGLGAEEQKRAGELAKIAFEAKAFTANLLGTAPDVPLRIVAVKRGAGFSSGGTIFIEESALRRQKVDSQTAMTIAEAVAKIWLGSANNINGEGFGVVREGLPRFIATQFIEKQYGKDVADVERLRQRTAYAAIVSRDAPLTIASPLDDYYFTSVTNKGAMIWRLLARKVGQDEFFNILRAQMKNGSLELNKLREAFSAQKELLDYSLDKVTDTNLFVGLPQPNGAETKVALRNVGSSEVTVDVAATTTANGEKLIKQTTIPAKSFGEVIFKTPNKIVRTEVDIEKIYPQVDYSDDIAPRESTESDAISMIKRAFDQQDFINTEKNARLVLREMPRFDDARSWLGRSLLAQNKNAEAEKEFRAVLDEKLPTARSLAWANVGLGEISLKSNQNSQAATFFNEAVKADAEYGATLTARLGRNKANIPSLIDESVKTFFSQYDKAAVSGRKADLDALILSGETSRFAGGIAGQAQQWDTKVLRVDVENTNDVLVEVSLNIKLLNKNPESGTAVFQLSKVGGSWKLSGVEIFEVR